MTSWFQEKDINIEKQELIYLDDLNGYVLPHAGTFHTKKILNSTLRFSPTKDFKKIIIIYYPANLKENIILEKKSYYQEFYVIYKIMKYMCTKIWNKKKIKIIGKNIRDKSFNHKYNNENLYIVSADFSHFKPLKYAIEKENCAAQCILYRSLNNNSSCLNEIDHPKSFKVLFSFLPKNFMLQWIGRSRSSGEKGVGYLSFLITNPKIKKPNGFFVTAYDSNMIAHECLGNVSGWNKKIENEKVKEVLFKAKTTSRLTGGRLINKNIKYYTITYLFKDEENTFTRGYHAVMTSALYLPSVFLENTYENGIWFDTFKDTEWNHSGDGKFNMLYTKQKLDIKGGYSEVKPTLFKTKVKHFSIKGKKTKKIKFLHRET